MIHVFTAFVCALAAQDAISRQPVVVQTPEVRTQRVLNVVDILDVDVGRHGENGVPLKRDAESALPAELFAVRVDFDGTQKLTMRQRNRDLPAADLEALIQTWMRPACEPWGQLTVMRRDERVVAGFADGRDAVVVATDGTLIAHLTADRHAWLDTFLAAQRDIPDLIDLEFVFVTADEHAFDSYFAESSVAMLARADADAALTKLRDNAYAEIVHSPSVCVFPRQHAQISALEEIAYVKDWKIVIVEPGAQVVADPQVDVVRDGFEIAARGTFLDPTHIGVEVTIAHSQVARPIATKQIHLGITKNSDVEVGVPDVTRVSLETQLRLELGHCALFRAPLVEPGRSAAVFVRASRRPLPSVPLDPPSRGR